MRNSIIKVALKAAVCMLIILVIYILGSKSYQFGRTIFSKDGFKEAPGEEIEVVVVQGDTVADIADELYEKKVIGDKNVFRIQAFLYEAKLKPGLYNVSNAASGEEIIELLSSGETSEEQAK